MLGLTWILAVDSAEDVSAAVAVAADVGDSAVAAAVVVVAVENKEMN